MGSQPNLASRSEVMSIYKCPQNVWVPSLKFGAQKSNFWPLPNLTPHISGTKRRINKQKCQYQSTMCLLNVDLLSVTLWHRNGWDLLIVTHPSAAITLQPSWLWHVWYIFYAQNPEEISHKWLWTCPPHLTNVTAVPCEMQNSCIWLYLSCFDLKSGLFLNGQLCCQMAT